MQELLRPALIYGLDLIVVSAHFHWDTGMSSVVTHCNALPCSEHSPGSLKKILKMWPNHKRYKYNLIKEFDQYILLKQCLIVLTK